MNPGFVLKIESIDISFKLFKGRENDFFLYCALIGQQGKYFFMDKDGLGKWKILPSISLPVEVAGIGNILSEKVTEAMNPDS